MWVQIDELDHDVLDSQVVIEAVLLVGHHIDQEQHILSRDALPGEVVVEKAVLL